MFGRRADGKQVKDLGIIEKATAYFMPMRIDAVQYFSQNINCEALDKFILEEKRNTGIHYTYTEILMAAAIRMIYQRPKTNRFVQNCVMFQRKYISLSIAVKKKLTDDSEELTLKMFFTGRESVADVKKIFDDELVKNLAPNAEQHKTNKTAGFLGRLPNCCFRWAVGLLRWGDKHGMLPRWLLDVSPFHTSIFVADLRSIHLDALYHHLYNFGNTTIFATLGKVNYVPTADRSGNVEVKKQLQVKYSLDERVCDGLYYSNSLKLLNSFLENPECLKERLPEPELSGKALKKQQKAERKAQKKAKKA